MEGYSQQLSKRQTGWHLRSFRPTECSAQRSVLLATATALQGPAPTGRRACIARTRPVSACLGELLGNDEPLQALDAPAYAFLRRLAARRRCGRRRPCPLRDQCRVAFACDDAAEATAARGRSLRCGAATSARRREAGSVVHGVGDGRRLSGARLGWWLGPGHRGGRGEDASEAARVHLSQIQHYG